MKNLQGNLHNETSDENAEAIKKKKNWPIVYYFDRLNDFYLLIKKYAKNS